MGEWSKSIGEKGEHILNFIFEDVLNFNSLQENITINCINQINHINKGAKKDRKTHGIDGLINYKSPLEDNCLEIGVISSKFTSEPYPKYPSALFKSYIKDLANTLECFNRSQLKSSINKNQSNVNKTDIFGILLWLSNNDNIYYDVISKVNSIQIDSNLIF